MLGLVCPPRSPPFIGCGTSHTDIPIAGIFGTWNMPPPPPPHAREPIRLSCCARFPHEWADNTLRASIPPRSTVLIPLLSCAASAHAAIAPAA